MSSPRHELRLYVGGHGARSTEALRVVRGVCDAELGLDRYDLVVIDVRENPSAARTQGVLAVPTLVFGARRAVGELSSRRVVQLLSEDPGQASTRADHEPRHE